MKQLFHKLNSWWFAIMVPQHGPLATISQRETMRKRRLLSLMIGSTLLLITISTVLTSSTAYSSLLFIDWIDCFILLLSLWLNRQGYLQLAGLLVFFTEGCSVLLSVHYYSFASPLSVLWSLSPIALILVMAGLFLSAWMIVLIATIETLAVLWYLLIERFTILASLLAPQERWNFLIYLVLVIFTSSMIGIFYTVTTKKALIQADRATELEQAHQTISRAYLELEVAHATIQKQALTDSLTGLPNHRAVMDQLSKELDHTRRNNAPFSLLFFDADHFKRVNDTYSHAAGDAVLRQIGERASSVLRGGDTLGRFGGEEFVLLLPDTTIHEARLIAERIRAAVASKPISTSQVEGGIAMTISIGISTYLSGKETEQDVLSQADAAMYLAKRLGRNQVRTAEEARQMAMDRELMALLQREEQREAIEQEKAIPS